MQGNNKQMGRREVKMAQCNIEIFHIKFRQMERSKKDPDIRGTYRSSSIPQKAEDPERRQIKRVMKSVTAPYQKFQSYYPLEEAIDLYMEIWYKDDSDSSY